MTFANNMDRDQVQRNVGPDLRSLLFAPQYQFLLKLAVLHDLLKF